MLVLYVCTKHYLEHVKLVNDELHPLSDQLNSIMNTIQQINATSLSRFATEQLEQWRVQSHELIDAIYDDKKKILIKIIESKLEEEKSVSKQLNQSLKTYTDEMDVSYQQVENIKREIRALETRCSALKVTDFFYIETKPLRLYNESPVIKANQFSYFRGDGELLQLEHQIQLNEWYGVGKQHWQLVYKAKHDGFQAKDFHRRSNDQGPTFTIIQSKEGGWLFGGYILQSWKCSSAYTMDKNNPFIFTLINPHNIPLTRYLIMLQSISNAVVHATACGPTFGGGYDLHVCNNSNSTAGSYFKFSHSYIDTTQKGPLTFTNNSEFQTSDIEVYRLA